MALFWRRKGRDQFVTLGLNEPAAEPEKNKDTAERTAPAQPELTARAESVTTAAERVSPGPPSVERVQVSGGNAEREPSFKETQGLPPSAARSPAEAEILTVPVASRSPFATSVLGLNLSMEELQAQEAALEQEFSARFRRAVAATRESLSERLDTVFQGSKQIDEDLLDELEEALIAADIGITTTQRVLETVRRGIARKQIDDLNALKQSIKNELLKILRAAETRGVASETSIADGILPYTMMIVGVNGVGKTTTIGKLAQRIKAEGNDVLICAADTFRAAASDQLAIWAERTGVPLIQQKQGTDPAAVLFDSLKAAKARMC